MTKRTKHIKSKKHTKYIKHTKYSKHKTNKTTTRKLIKNFIRKITIIKNQFINNLLAKNTFLAKITNYLKRNPITQLFARIDRWFSNKLEYKVRYSPKLATSFMLFKYIIDVIGFPIFGAILLFTAPHGALLTISWIFMFLINEFILKNIFKRSRPFMFDGDWSEKNNMFGYSFPSTHACNAGYLITIWLHFHLPYTKLMIGIFTIIPISRVVLNYHFLGDIIAGLLIGISWALTTLRLI